MTEKEVYMSEWPNQISELQGKWVEQQQKLLTDWLASMKSAGGSTPPNVWREAIDILEQQVNSALDAQKQSLKVLAENAKHVEGAPEPLTQWCHQLEAGMEMWNDMQQRLWQVWFDTLRTTAAPAVQSPGETLVRNWQEMAQRAKSIQEQWLSNWTGLPTSSSVRPGDKSRK
jgi:hypothetical protein